MQLCSNFIFRFMIIGSLIIIPTNADAFYRNRIDATGQKVFWRDDALPIRYSVSEFYLPTNMTLENFQGAIDAAYVQWDNRPNSKLRFINTPVDDIVFTLLYVALLEEVDPNLGVNTHNVISPLWEADELPTWDDFGYGDGTIAVTISYLRGPNGGHATNNDVLDGALLDGDVVYNNINFNFCNSQVAPCASDEMDLVTIAAHEVGHQIGLDHQPNDVDSLMYPKIDLATTKELSNDELTSIDCIYPIATGSVEHFEACLLEDNSGGIPASETYLYGDSNPDNSGACAGVLPLSRKPPSNTGNAVFNFLFMLTLIVLGKKLHATITIGMQQLA